VLKNDFFGFPKVKWLRLTGVVDKYLRCSCEIFLGFNIPKSVSFWQSYSTNGGRFLGGWHGVRGMSVPRWRQSPASFPLISSFCFFLLPLISLCCIHGTWTLDFFQFLFQPGCLSEFLDPKIFLWGWHPKGKRKLAKWKLNASVSTKVLHMYGWDLDYKWSVHLFFQCWCEKGVARDLAENVCVCVC